MIPIWSKLLISFMKAGTQKVPYLYLILLPKAQTVGHTRTPIRILTEKEKGKGKELGRQKKDVYSISLTRTWRTAGTARRVQTGTLALEKWQYRSNT